jgi:hypothetical protein
MVTSIYTIGNRTLKIYFDGVLDNTITNVDAPNAHATAAMYIGEDNPALGTGYFYNGSLNDLRIYNRAIDTSEVRHLFVATTAPTANLIAYWPLTRTATDQSGHNYNGASNNVTATTDRFGNPFGAYGFNGASSYVRVPDTVTLRLDSASFTFNAWVKLSSYNSSFGSVIVSKRSAGADNGWSWGITGASTIPTGTVSYRPDGFASAIGNVVIPLNTWHMVTSVYTLSNHTLQIYVDGVLDNTTAAIPAPKAMENAQLFIGEDDPALGTGYHFEGAINDVRIYRKALTGAERNQLLNALN